MYFLFSCGGIVRTLYVRVLYCESLKTKGLKVVALPLVVRRSLLCTLSYLLWTFGGEEFTSYYSCAYFVDLECVRVHAIMVASYCKWQRNKGPYKLVCLYIASHTIYYALLEFMCEYFALHGVSETLNVIHRSRIESRVSLQGRVYVCIMGRIALFAGMLLQNDFCPMVYTVFHVTRFFTVSISCLGFSM